MSFVCLVCGYEGLETAPYDERGVASDEICPCCGFHFGFDDDDIGEIAFQRWREKWINSGKQWFSRGRKAPENWNPEIQLLKLGTNNQ